MGQVVFNPGDLVRLIGDPQRVGVFRGEEVRAGRTYGRVQLFSGGMSNFPIDQLEAVPGTQEEPIDFLRDLRFSEPARLRQVLAHIRLTGRLADVIYSMEATNTEFHAHQFKPVLKMLSSPTGSLLIADEVGLGKTIEAGLIWTELRARFDYRRLLVVCPKVLCSKWEAELTGKFGLDARIFSAADLLAALSNRQRMEQGFVAICGLQGLRPPKRWDDEDDPLASRASARLARLLSERAEDEPIFDMLVVDEAHHLRNPETQSNALAGLLQPLAQHVAFLSATPIHLRNRDLFSLLALIDPQTFHHGSVLDEILDANNPLIAAREATLRGRPIAELRERLAESELHPLLSGSQQIAILQAELGALSDPLPMSDRARLAARLEQVNLLANAINRTRRRDVEELRVVRRVTAYAEEMAPIEREAYDAITKVVQRHAWGLGIPAGFLLATPQRLLASCLPAAVDHWRRQIPDIEIEDEEATPDDEEETATLALRPLVARIAEACATLPLPSELERHDSKFARFLKVLGDFLAGEPDEKVIVFSTFRATLHYLACRLEDAGIRCLMIHGGTPDRDAALSRFETDRELSVLLSSEVGSEGIDLQFSRTVINYDLPWNPMRLEQRIGRVDRLGQAAEFVTVINIMHSGTIDDEIYRRLYDRLKLCERALGGFEAVLGEAISKLTPELLTGALTIDQIAERIEQTRQAIENRLKIEEELEHEAAALIAHGDHVLRSIRTSHEMHRWIGAGDLARYLADSLTSLYPGSSVRDLDRDDLYEILLSSEARRAFVAWLQDRRLPMGSRLERGEPALCRLGRPAPGRGAGRAIETVAQTHPLVRFIADRVADTEAPKLRPAVAARLPMDRQRTSPPLAPGRYAVLGMLWIFGGQVTQEQIAYAGMDLPAGTPIPDETAEALMLTAAEYGALWADAETAIDGDTVADLCDERLRERLMQRFNHEEAERKAEQDDRAAIQLRTLEQRFSEQRSRLRDLIETQRRRAVAGASGAGRAVAMNEAKLQRLEQRTAMRRDEIRRRRLQTAEAKQLAVTVIELIP